MIRFLHKSLVFYLFLFAYLSVNSQTTISIIPTFSGNNLELNKDYCVDNQKDTFKISTLKFYVSDITFWKENHSVYNFEKSHLLLDLEKPNSLTLFNLNPESKEFTSIKFKLGIDSVTNVSGALGGDLDPTNGMYWAWQSGYINFKMEGTSTNCPARKNKFQFHLGGYISPYYGMREIEIPVINEKNIHIEIDLQTLFNSIDLSETYQIMSPNEEAMRFASELSTLFKIKK